MTGVRAPGPDRHRPTAAGSTSAESADAFQGPGSIHLPGPIRRLTSRVSDHLHRRLDEMERSEPDGAVATWRWMWRALERSSTSVWRLRLRFATRVVADMVLLAVWWCLRPLSLLRRGSPRRAVVTAGVLGMLCGFLWLEERRAGPRLPYAHLEVHASGILTFAGQRIRTHELQGTVDHYRISVLDLSLHGDVSVGTVVHVQEILASAGIPRVKLRMNDAEGDLRTRR